MNPSIVPIDTTLNTFIRSYARLTGTKFMCLEGGCGVCITNITGLKTASNQPRSIAVNSVRHKIALVFLVKIVSFRLILFNFIYLKKKNLFSVSLVGILMPWLTYNDHWRAWKSRVWISPDSTNIVRIQRKPVRLLFTCNGYEYVQFTGAERRQSYDERCGEFIRWKYLPLHRIQVFSLFFQFWIW